MPPEKSTPPPPKNALQVVEMLLKNGDIQSALDAIKNWGLKVKIENGRVIDVSDGTENWLSRFITCDPDMIALKDDVRKLAPEQDEVLIAGETGTGKELIARALHGERKGKFVAINCAGLPRELIESELFGHKQGAFTGAVATKQGLMAVARDGTLFLDEIGELPIDVQGKLLRALQEKLIRKVGDDKSEEINCRVVSATNRNLREMTAAKQFRVDLYARLSTFELHTKPLRDRQKDVVMILESLDGGKEFLDKCTDRTGLVADLIPFNVRSLQQIVRRYKVLGHIPK